MRNLLILLMFLVLSSCATATPSYAQSPFSSFFDGLFGSSSCSSGDGSIWCDVPEEYRHEYPGDLIVVEMDYFDIDTYYDTLYPNNTQQYRVVGFVMESNGLTSCTVVVPTVRSTSQSYQQRVLVHEVAHCNGWSGSHER